MVPAGLCSRKFILVSRRDQALAGKVRTTPSKVVPMTARGALKVVLAISLVGVAFSGTLTYRELCSGPGGGGCSAVGAPGTILGYPACVYGLGMYLLLVAVAAFGLRGDS